MQIDLDTAKSIIAGQFPQWAGLAISAYESSGTDHLLFRLGDQMAARFPINENAARSVQEEWAGLKRLSDLPLATPQILAEGNPDTEFPYYWSVVNWIEGQDASTATVSDWVQTACQLGAFVRALHNVEGTGVRKCGGENAYRGSALAVLDSWTRTSIDSVSDTFDRYAMLAVWEAALAVPVWDKEPVWIHGDIHAANIVVRNAQVAGIIDFGLSALGDPACDLALAWSYLPADTREFFFDAVEADGGTIRRGKGWALYIGAIALSYYRDRNPVLARMGIQAISSVLEDAS
jgi:aminoglycoside phosphotransferase (APT) family kinase protein